MQSHPLLGRLKLWHKFAILSLLAALLSAMPTYFYVRESGKALDTYIGEQRAIAPAATILKLIQLTQQHRGLSAALLGGASTVADKRSAKQAETEQSCAAVDTLVASLGDADISALWTSARRDWETLRAGVSAASITVDQSFAAHSNLLQKLLKLGDLVGDHYGLSLDPDKDSYHLIQTMFYQLPFLAEELGRTRAKGTGLLASHMASPGERLALAAIIARVNDRIEQMQAAFHKAVMHNRAIDAELGDQLRAALAAAGQFAKVASEQIVEPETLNYSTEQYLAIATAAIDAQFKLNTTASKSIEAVLERKISRLQMTLLAMVGAMLVLMALAGVVVLMIMRSITRPLASAIALARRVADGDLANDVDVGPPDEVGQLLRALKDMNDSLRHIVGDVSASVATIGVATRDIAGGNADVSRRLEAQASSLQEAASSMEQLTSTVQQNADSAQHANALVLGASGVAARGGDVVSEVVRTMAEINDSARRIVDIIAVIDGIAFQTNILALNAAVEAARAGEQGRGFAVVASEVRTLAQRSAAAAKEIKGLIGHSVDRVEAGNRLVDQAGLAMREIVDAVGQITQIMAEIAAASVEQGSGIAQVSQAVTAMDDMTQRNAALVEQTAAASASLEEQAQALIRAIGVFRLADDGRAPKRTPPASSRGALLAANTPST